MAYYLKLRKHPEVNRFIYYSYLEEIPLGGVALICEKWKYAEEFETREEALKFKSDFDDLDHFIITDTLGLWQK